MRFDVKGKSYLDFPKKILLRRYGIAGMQEPAFDKLKCRTLWGKISYTMNSSSQTSNLVRNTQNRRISFTLHPLCIVLASIDFFISSSFAKCIFIPAILLFISVFYKCIRTHHNNWNCLLHPIVLMHESFLSHLNHLFLAS